MLVPFLEEHFPHGHRFQQDNDLKHTSRWAQDYYENRDINWWRTPPSSPDLNPIENVWGSKKEYLHRETKPKNEEELKAGMKGFLENSNSKCMQKVHSASQSHS